MTHGVTWSTFGDENVVYEKAQLTDYETAKMYVDMHAAY